MKHTVIFSILLFTGVILGSSQVIAKKAGSKSYTCISASNGRFLITDSNKTNKFKLYGVVFPTKKNLKQFAKDSDTKVEDLKNSLPNLNNYLSRYNGRTVKIKKSFRSGLWLEGSNGKCINLEVVENGIALPDKNVKHEYKKQFQKAKGEAIKNAAGIWALPACSNPSRDIRIEFSSKNIKKKKETRTRQYSSSYSKHRTWENMREITLDFNTFDLKRKIDLVIKYQFKIVSYEGSGNRTNKRNVFFSKIQTKNITVFPPENTKTIIESPKLTLYKYSYSGGNYSYSEGKDYVGEAVAIYYNDEVIFKRGELKQ